MRFKEWFNIPIAEYLATFVSISTGAVLRQAHEDALIENKHRQDERNLQRAHEINVQREIDLHEIPSYHEYEPPMPEYMEGNSGGSPSDFDRSSSFDCYMGEHDMGEPDLPSTSDWIHKTESKPEVKVKELKIEIEIEVKKEEFIRGIEFED
jgi:hypothetical protein